MENLTTRALEELKISVRLIELATEGYGVASYESKKEAVNNRYNNFIGALNSLHVLGIISDYDFQIWLTKGVSACKEM